MPGTGPVAGTLIVVTAILLGFTRAASAPRGALALLDILVTVVLLDHLIDLLLDRVQVE